MAQSYDLTLRRFARLVGNVGGKTIADCISRMMPAIISHEIVSRISHTGKGTYEGESKLAFDSLENLKKVICSMFKNLIIAIFTLFYNKENENLKISDISNAFISTGEF